MRYSYYFWGRSSGPHFIAFQMAADIFDWGGS